MLGDFESRMAAAMASSVAGAGLAVRAGAGVCVMGCGGWAMADSPDYRTLPSGFGGWGSGRRRAVV